MKAWPIDPLALRDLKLEVSEKLPIHVAALQPGVRPRLVDIIVCPISVMVFGDALKLRGPPKANATKPPEPIGWWPCRNHGYGKKAFGCYNGQSAAKPLSRKVEGKVQRLDGCGLFACEGVWSKV